MSKRKKIVCFAGGSVVPEIILEPLKNLEVDLVGVTSMVDNGGSTGVLRKELGVHPAGDIRRHLLALSEAEEWKKKLWEFRFLDSENLSPGHFGHNFANIFIGGLESIYNDFEKALDISHDFLRVRGRALPATLGDVHLCATLENERKIKGEDEIDSGEERDRNLKIKEIYLEPSAKAYPKALAEIAEADFLIIGPGDLYSSILPCFLPEGMSEAISKAKAEKIFICPLMLKRGETLGFLVSDFCREVEKYIKCPLDIIIYNNEYPSNERIEKYEKATKFLKGMVLADGSLDKNKFVGKNLLTNEGDIKHDKDKLLEVLREIINI